MSAGSSFSAPPQRFVAVSAVVLAAILFWVVLTLWVPEHWSFGFAEAGVLALGAAWGICLALRPYAVQSSPILIPLAGTVVIGLAQLLTAHTANRWETWNAVLRWAVYSTAFFLASQIGASQDVLRPFRLALLYFGFGRSEDRRVLFRSWETWNAVLRWAVYSTAFFLASQIGASQDVLRPIRLALLYFGFG